MNSPFTVISHTADIKIGVCGATLEELFSHALVGMFQVIEPRTNQPGCARHNGLLICKQLPVTRIITVNSPDIEALLVDFLSEALALSDIHNEAYLAAQITLEKNNVLQATLHGIPISGFEVTEIKAVTYAGLIIRHEQGIWSAEIVFDI